MGISRHFSFYKQETQPLELILASQSNYKRQQLSEMGLDFTSISPDVQENHLAAMDPQALAIDLATQKAKAIFKLRPDAIVIGSDQTAVNSKQQLLTKPGSPEKARAQLLECSGTTALFYSAICIMSSERTRAWSVTTRVVFRDLNEAEISRYVEKDNPLDCAGSFKVESLGIALFERIESEDPTALIGLPMISLCAELRRYRLELP